MVKELLPLEDQSSGGAKAIKDGMKGPELLQSLPPTRTYSKRMGSPMSQQHTEEVLPEGGGWGLLSPGGKAGNRCCLKN